MEINTQAIGRNLKAIRTTHNLTIKQMAEALGVSFQHWAAVDRGERLPSLDVLVLICQKFNISLNEIFSLPREQEQHLTEIPAELKQFSDIDSNNLLTMSNFIKIIASEADKAGSIINPQLMGQRLRIARTNAGLTIRQVARRAGLAWGYLQKLESGKNIPSLQTLKQLVEVLQISPDYLFASDIPTSREILYSEFIKEFSTMSKQQQEIALCTFEGYLNGIEKTKTE